MLVLHKPDVVSPITHRAYGAAGMKNTASTEPYTVKKNQSNSNMVTRI